jgi:hypothetical protein
MMLLASRRPLPERPLFALPLTISTLRSPFLFTFATHVFPLLGHFTRQVSSVHPLPSAVAVLRVGAFSGSGHCRQPTHAREREGEGRHTRINWARSLATGSFSARAMYESSGGCPTTLEYVSRWMFVLNSQLVVSGWPVPMYFAWSRSSSCWVRSLSALFCVGLSNQSRVMGVRYLVGDVPFWGSNRTWCVFFGLFFWFVNLEIPMLSWMWAGCNFGVRVRAGDSSFV